MRRSRRLRHVERDDTDYDSPTSGQTVPVDRRSDAATDEDNDVRSEPTDAYTESAKVRKTGRSNQRSSGSGSANGSTLSAKSTPKQQSDELTETSSRSDLTASAQPAARAKVGVALRPKLSDESANQTGDTGKEGGVAVDAGRSQRARPGCTSSGAAGRKRASAATAAHSPKRLRRSSSPASASRSTSSSTEWGGAGGGRTLVTALVHRAHHMSSGNGSGSGSGSGDMSFTSPVMENSRSTPTSL